MGEFENYVGKGIHRVDAIEIVTGRAKFVSDLRFPQMLFGGVLGSPYAHAIVRNIDKGSALSMEGVEAVITWQDVSQRWRGGTPPIVPILDRRLRFVGDAVALVGARSQEILKKALECIRVDYEPLNFALDVESALSPDVPPLYEQLDSNLLPPGVPAFGPTCLTDLIVGDVKKGFEEADFVVEGNAFYENIPNALTLEPPSVIALWEPPNRVTLWVSSQSPFREREILYRVFNGEMDIRVIGVRCGGSFGSRALAWRWHCYAILLSMATGKPVKMVMTKEEQLSTSVLRIGCRLTARIGIKKDGTVTAISGDLIVDTGYYSRTTQAQVAVGLGELQLMLRCSNWDLRTKIVCTNRAASGQIRGFGGQEFKCVMVPILSKALAKIDMDPVTFFKKNFVRPGNSYYWRDGRLYEYRGIDFTRMIEEGARTFGWQQKWKGWLKPTEVNGPKRIGVGVGIHGNADIGEDASEVLLYLYPDGSASIIGCIAEFGTGQTTNFLRFVAEILKLPMERIKLAPADSAFTPYVGPAGGSRGTYAIGSAIIKAAQDARLKLLARFSLLLGVPLSELDTENGEIFLKREPFKRWPWKAMGSDWTIVGFGRFEPDYTLCNCMITFVEVEVDTETGYLVLRRIVNATDVGKIIDPLGLEAQMNGCLGSAGIDSALFEETVIDRKTGRVLNNNLIDYKWRTFHDLPEIINVVLETPFPSHCFGAVGVGEITTSPGPSAVLMAVSNAISRWINTYPLSPSLLLNLIHVKDT
ncbi:MAG: xanthine dehydrogenase family protein molybdopterin-binding subunit [Candidatus Bathyarchaeia archaeon]